MGMDHQLVVCENVRPAITPGALISPGVLWPMLLPSAVAPNYWDLRTIMDLCSARPLYAQFRIATTFNSIAANILRFAIFVANSPDFVDVASDGSNIIARGHDINGSVLLAGMEAQIAMPPMSAWNRIANENGRRYVGLGFEYYVPTTDWSAGGITAFLTHTPLMVKPPSNPAGW
jgi:hypothetical protein